MEIFRDCHRRARQLADALTRLGVKPSDRIGTLAWNGYRHMELYYGMSGMGAFFEGEIAKCWTPDVVVFADAVPLGATGKVLKNQLREVYQDYPLS